MKMLQKSDTVAHFINFHVDLKNLIGFAIATCGKSKPAFYFKGSKIRIFKGKRLVWMTPVSMGIRIRLLDYSKSTQIC